MKRLAHLSFWAVAFSALLLTSCRPVEPDEKPKKVEVKTMEFIDASDYAKWVFVNLETGKVYKTTEYDLETGKFDDLASENLWDIAFHRWDVKTKVGAFKSNLTDLEKAGEEKNIAFVTDTEADVVYVFNHDKQKNKVAKTAISKVISGGYQPGGWMHVNIANMPPSYNLSKNIFFVKTVMGKTVALQFTDYKKKDGKPVGVSFKYVVL